MKHLTQDPVAEQSVSLSRRLIAGSVYQGHPQPWVLFGRNSFLEEPGCASLAQLGI